MASTKRLPLTKFNAILLLLPRALTGNGRKTRERRIDMARKVLVEGWTMAATAAVYGCTRQSIQLAVNQVWDMGVRFDQARFLMLSDDEEGE